MQNNIYDEQNNPAASSSVTQCKSDILHLY